jgi:hypothetical protein
MVVPLPCIEMKSSKQRDSLQRKQKNREKKQSLTEN